MGTPCGNTIEETEYSMLYDEEFILFSNCTLIKDNLFYTFSVTVAIWDNFLGHNYKGTYNAKENNKSDVGIKT